MVCLIKSRTFWFVALTLLLTFPTGEASKCECGVFNATVPKTDAEPILKMEAPFAFSSNQNGAYLCAHLCVAMAHMGRKRAAHILCDVIKELDIPFEPSIYSRLFNEMTWKNTGFSSDKKLCCMESIPMPCYILSILANIKGCQDYHDLRLKLLDIFRSLS